MLKKFHLSLFIIGLFLVAFFIRLFPIRLEPHYWDECVYLQHADIFSGKTPADFYNEFYLRPPLLPFFISLFYIFFHSELLANFLIAFLSSLGVPLLYLLGRELFDKETGVIASFIYTFLPLSLSLSHSILVDSILPTFWIISFLFIFRFLEKGRALDASLAGFFVGLSVLLKFTSLVLIVFFIFVCLFKKIKSTYFFLTLLLTLSPFLIFNTILFSDPIHPFIQGFLIVNNDIPTSLFSFYSDFDKIFPIIFLILLPPIFFDYWKKKKIPQIHLLLWFLILLLFIPMHFFVHKEIRFLLPVSPFLLLFPSLKISEWLREKKEILSLILIFLIIFTPLFLYFQAFEWKMINEGKLFYNATSDVLSAGLWLKTHTSENDIIYANYEYPCLAYYSKRKTIVLPFWKKFNISDIMDRKGYYVLFKDINRTPTLEEIQKSSKFRLEKEISDRVQIYFYEP